jgi:hypothetical protein
MGENAAHVRDGRCYAGMRRSGFIQLSAESGHTKTSPSAIQLAALELDHTSVLQIT